MLPVLDAVHAELDVTDADLIMVTDDHAAGPQPVQVLDRLTALGDRALLVRGNADRELGALARGEPSTVGMPTRSTRGPWPSSAPTRSPASPDPPPGDRPTSTSSAQSCSTTPPPPQEGPDAGAVLTGIPVVWVGDDAHSEWMATGTRLVGWGAALVIAAAGGLWSGGSAVAAAPPRGHTVRAGDVPALDVTTYHGDRKRSGYYHAAPLTTMTRSWDRDLGAAVYGQPLVLTVAGLRTVVVATETDVVYGLDPATGAVRWSSGALGTPLRRDQLPCGNIDPLGITGTPVYDPDSQVVFVVAEVADSGGAVHHDLVGVDPSGGHVVSRVSADPAGQDPTVEQERGALFLENGTVYVPYGGLAGDCGAYHGYVVSIAERGGAVRTYRTPSSREAGIWAPPGLVSDHVGNIYVAVGNGAATGGTWDRSDSVVELTPDLHVLGAFAPTRWAADNAADADLGSTAPTVLADGVVYADGKSSTAYTLRDGALQGVGTQLSTATVCASYGGTAYLVDTVYVPCTDGIRSVRIASSGQLTVLWHAPYGVSGSPVRSGSTVWSVDRGAGDLVALAVDTGAVQGRVAIGDVSRFATPALSGTQAFLGTMTGVVAVDGI